jgi:hypothetical protein
VVTGLAFERPQLLAVSAVTFALTFVGYSWPFRRRLLRGHQHPSGSHVEPI